MSASQSNRWLTYGVAMMALAGEPAHGDRYVVKQHPEGVLLSVIDGLGHGSEAARAADIAVGVVEASPTHDPEELVAQCHRELRQSRGVVMTIVSLAPASGKALSVGVGNVQGMIIRQSPGKSQAERDFFLLRGGVVGHIMPPVRASTHPLVKGDTMILATDGVGIEFTTEDRLDGAPQALAERIISRYALKTDDALVLVARYTGP